MNQSPAAILPSELVSQIFLLSLPYAGGRLPALRMWSRLEPRHRLNLCQISSAWRQVALSTARMWNELTIELDYMPKGDFLRRLEEVLDTANNWLSRAGSMALVIRVNCQLRQDVFDSRLFIDFIASHANRCRKLHLSMPDVALVGSLIIACGNPSWDSLEALHLENGFRGGQDGTSDALLTSIAAFNTARSLRCVRYDGGSQYPASAYSFKLPGTAQILELPIWPRLTNLDIGVYISVDAFLSVLSRCRRLQSSAVDLVPCDKAMARQLSELTDFVAPELTRLDLTIGNFPEDAPRNYKPLFLRLSLPMLTEMAITCGNKSKTLRQYQTPEDRLVWDSQGFEQLAANSSFRLQKISFHGVKVSPVELESFFRQNASLTEVDFDDSWFSPAFDARVCSLIASGELLPNLTVLKLEPFVKTLSVALDMIEARGRIEHSKGIPMISKFQEVLLTLDAWKSSDKVSHVRHSNEVEEAWLHHLQSEGLCHLCYKWRQQSSLGSEDATDRQSPWEESDEEDTEEGGDFEDEEEGESEV